MFKNLHIKTNKPSRSTGKSSILFSLESHLLGGRGELSICPGMIGIEGLSDCGLLLPLSELIKNKYLKYTNYPVTEISSLHYKKEGN